MARTKNSKRSDGRLQSKVYLGVVDGKAKYKYVYATTQKELNAKINEVKLQLGKGLDVSARRDTFGEWAQRWLKFKKIEVSDHRYYIYECRIKNLSALEYIEVPKIRSMDIQDIIIELSEKYSKSVLKEWTDINLKSGTISVTKSMSRSGNNWTIKQGAKTEAGVRTVYIPDLLIEYLRNVDRKNNLFVCPDATGHIMSLSAWNKLWDSYLAELNFQHGDFSHIMVPDKSGVMSPFKKPKSRFAPVKVPMVIPQITPHWLRHTFITSMYLAGVDVLTAKEQAGHADINTTMSIYTHLDAVHKLKQIDKLNEYYGCQMGVNENLSKRNTG